MATLVDDAIEAKLHVSKMGCIRLCVGGINCSCTDSENCSKSESEKRQSP